MLFESHGKSYSENICITPFVTQKTLPQLLGCFEQRYKVIIKNVRGAFTSVST